MRAFGTIVLLVWTTACGDDGGSPPGGDARAIDAPVSIIDAGGADVVSSLGELCATNAPDGSPASCPGAVCCTVSGTTICVQPDDCADSPMFVPCAHTPDCSGGRICCALMGTMFCTKRDACEAYGGTVVP